MILNFWSKTKILKVHKAVKIKSKITIVKIQNILIVMSIKI
jgi:hypothetical protein